MVYVVSYQGTNMYVGSNPFEILMFFWDGNGSSFPMWEEYQVTAWNHESSQDIGTLLDLVNEYQNWRSVPRNVLTLEPV